MASNDNLKIVFGSMTFAKPGTLGARVHDLKTAGEIVDIFRQHGHSEIDSARLYGYGSSEEMLGDLDWQKRALLMGTKLFPVGRRPMPDVPHFDYTHTPEDIRRGLLDSLKALGSQKIDLFYLHGPDRQTPIEETLREVNKLHLEGYFNRFGISNYYSWEVAQICEICRKHEWIQPTVYQGIYHALHRRVEDELIPCLRHYGISLYAFSPLAGGYLTGRYTRDQTDFEEGSRFDPKHLQGKFAQGRYWNDVYFDAIDEIKAISEKNGLTMAEVAVRWLKHNSELKHELGDAIITGASSVKHQESNLVDLEKGPLPKEVVEVVEGVWPKVKGVAPAYWL